MKNIWSIFKFVFTDNLRSIWAIAYMLFFAFSTYSLIYFTGSFTRSVASLMNIIILIVPLVSTMMAAMYYYNKSDLLYLLLSQPVKRSHTFLGIYLGIAITLGLAVTIGLGLGVVFSAQYLQSFGVVIILIVSAILLSLIFSALTLFIAVSTKDKLKGIGLSIFIWLFFAVIYDGLLLIYFIVYSDYPIEQHAIFLTMLNPIDLSRVFIMLQLDVSALLGYSGAVFQKFYGSGSGQFISLCAMLFWVIFPLFGLLFAVKRKDY